MLIQLDLSDNEIEYLSTCCIGRVLKSAMDAVPDNYEYIDDLEEALVYERLRSRIVNKVFEQKVADASRAELTGSKG